MFRLPICFLLWLFCAASQFHVAQAAAAPGWHIETAPAEEIVATDTVTVSYPNRNVSVWSLMATVPPELPSQTGVTLTMQVPGLAQEVSTTEENSSLKRATYMLRFPVNSQLFSNSVTVKFTYKATLIARRIMRGNPRIPVVPLKDVERGKWLAVTPTLDYRALDFQSWLIGNSLHKRPNEQDVLFAYRVYSFIKQKYTYNYIDSQDRKVSALCKTNLTDCGGSVNLLVGALRANGIPARQLVGRNAVDGTSGEYGGSRHVRSEFFAEGIGWVPVEMSSGMSFKDQPDNNFFGYDRGNFLTTHLDTDLLIDYGIDGVQKEQWAQSMRFWLKSTWNGTPTPPQMTGNWKVFVKDIPLQWHEK